MSPEEDREALCRVMDASDPEMGGVVADEGHESWEWYIPMADAILAAGFCRPPAPAPDARKVIEASREFAEALDGRLTEFGNARIHIYRLADALEDALARIEQRAEA